MKKEKYDGIEFAAITYALGVVRGFLSNVQNKDFDAQESKEILEGTSSENIAAVISKNENEIAVDWNEYLTDDQKRKIQGCRD